MRKIATLASITLLAFGAGVITQLLQPSIVSLAAIIMPVASTGVDKTGDICAGQPKHTICRPDAVGGAPVDLVPPSRSATYTTGFPLIQFVFDPNDKGPKPRCVSHRFVGNCHSMCYVSRQYCDYNLVPGDE